MLLEPCHPLRDVAQDLFKPILTRNISRRTARAPEPGIEHLSGQPVFGARLARFDDELMHPLWVIGDVLTVAEPVDCQADGFVQRARIQFDGVLDAIAVAE